MKNSTGDQMHYFKLVSLWVHRDEQLSQALAMEAERPPLLLEIGEQYLEVARRTAELAEALEGGALGSVGTGILQGLAQQYYDLGGHYAADPTKAIAYAKACEERLRESLEAQMARIDSGEEKCVPLSREKLQEMLTGVPGLTQLVKAFPHVSWREPPDAHGTVVGSIDKRLTLAVSFRRQPPAGAYVATLGEGGEDGISSVLFEGPPAPTAVAATKALLENLKNLEKIYPQLDFRLSK